MSRASVSSGTGAWRVMLVSLVATSLLACASSAPGANAPEPVAARSNIAGLDSAVPKRVGEFQLVDRHRVPGAAGDMAYRYRDASPANVSLYIYPIDYPGAESSGGPRERVAHEGGLLLQLMPIQVQRHVYDSFEPLVSRPDSLVVRGMLIPGYVTGVRVHRGAATVHELQLLHLVGGDFVKLRATIPEDYSIATLRALDSGIVAALVRP